MNVIEYLPSSAQAVIAVYLTAVLREPGSNVLCEVTLHPQCCVLLTESFELGPHGFGQVLVGNQTGFSRYFHP